MNDATFRMSGPRLGKTWPVTGAAAFAQDVRNVTAAGGGTAVLVSPEPVDPNYAPGVLVEKDRRIRAALSAAEEAGFLVEVKVSMTEARVDLTPVDGR